MVPEEKVAAGEILRVSSLWAEIAVHYQQIHWRQVVMAALEIDSGIVALEPRAR